MIQKIRIKKTPYGNYTAGNDYPVPDSFNLIDLGVLLSDEIRPGDDISWITDPDVSDRSGNESYSFKDGSDIVVEITYFTYSDHEQPFRVNKNIFLKLVQTWMKIYKLYPDRIELTQEDDKFTFEFDTKDGHQKIVVE